MIVLSYLKTRRVISICALLLSLVAPSAYSSLIDQGSTTYDTDTGLTWLDIDKTLGLTPSDVLAGAGGFLASGWSVASGVQVDTLFENAGVPSPAADLNIFFDTMVTDFLLATIGQSASTSSGGAFGQAWALNSPGVYSAPNYTSEPASLSFTRGSSALLAESPSRLIGVYLVRSDFSPVPVHNTLLLVVFGLALLVWHSRQRIHRIQ